MKASGLLRRIQSNQSIRVQLLALNFKAYLYYPTIPFWNLSPSTRKEQYCLVTTCIRIHYQTTHLSIIEIPKA